MSKVIHDGPLTPSEISALYALFKLPEKPTCTVCGEEARWAYFRNSTPILYFCAGHNPQEN
jgi:hypothetical protein